MESAMELSEMTNKDIYRQKTNLRKEKRTRKKIGFWPAVDPENAEDWMSVNMKSPTEMTNEELHALLDVMSAERLRRKKIGQWTGARVSKQRRVAISRARSIQNNNTSGCKGVTFSKNAKKWQAKIGIGGGKSKHLGYFETIDEAISARKSAEAEFWGV